MPRRPRLALAGIPCHIIQRGNNRSACFYAPEDYDNYLDNLTEMAKRFHCQIHAYCLMTNHVHLLVTPQQTDSASLMMKHLGQRYVQTINRRYRRSGTLWEGRFKSCLAQNEHYVLTCYRYIELNPVRANMTNHPEDYPWSSHKTNGLGAANTIITPHEDYQQLGTTPNQRQCAYRQLVTTQLEQQQLDEIRKATNGNYVLGNNRFQQEIAAALGRRVTPGKTGRPGKKP
jgi:putative transposase